MNKLWFCLNFCRIKIKSHLNNHIYYRYVFADSYSLFCRNQHKIIIREQLCYCHRCHLLRTVVTKNLVSLFHAYTYHIGKHQYYFLSMKNLLWKSCVTVSYVYMSYRNIKTFQSENLVSVFQSTVTVPFIIRKSSIYTSNLSGSLRSPAAPRSSAPWRVTTSGLRQRLSSGTLQQLCQHICQSINVCTDQ